MSQNDTMRPRVNAREIGRLYGVSCESIRRWTRLGILPAVKVGRQLRYDVTEVGDALRRAEDRQWRGGA